MIMKLAIFTSCLVVSGAMSAQTKALKQTPQPTRISDQLQVIPGGWAGRVPSEGAVNVPGHLEVLAPGQRIGLALFAQGDGRDQALKGQTLQVTITSSLGSVTLTPLPTSVRHIKASGADMVMSVLKASGITGPTSGDLERLTSMVSLVAFDLPWEAPAVTKEEIITLQAEVKGGNGSMPALKPITLKVRPWSAWWGDPSPSEKDLDAFEKGFHEQPEPGRLLPMLKVAAHSRALEIHGVYGFFVGAFRTQPAARAAAMTELPKMEPIDRWALLLVLRLGGEDVSGAMAGLQQDVQESLRGVIPLADPPALLTFKDPVDPQEAVGLGIPMDQCWGGWMATGDPKYLRGLVGQLAWAADYEDLQTWMKAKGGTKGLNARVARGLAYRTAGWSLSAFQRNDPQVADWLAFWEKDPSMPEGIRAQLAALPTNKAFQQEP